MIELLVVIAILAVLATAVVLVLNPAELLKEGRDSTRVSDLAAINDAIGLWTADVLGGNAGVTWGSNNGKWGSNDAVYCTSSTTIPTGILVTGSTCTATTTTSVAGSGWLPLNFTLIAAGSPLPKLPIDPNNGSTNCSQGTPAVCEYIVHVSSTIGIYKLAAQMESVKFRANGSGDVNSDDGGTSNSWYEIGSNLTSW